MDKKAVVSMKPRRSLKNCFFYSNSNKEMHSVRFTELMSKKR